MKHVITSLAFASILVTTSMALAGKKGHWFDKLDANKDGKITLDEARAAKDALFTKLDANNDGAISRAEWDARKGGKEGKSGKFKGRMFEKMDKDGDGKITRAEARAAAEAMFQRLDENGDGVVTQEEFKAHKGKHRKGGGKARS